MRPSRRRWPRWRRCPATRRRPLPKQTLTRCAGMCCSPGRARTPFWRPTWTAARWRRRCAAGTANRRAGRSTRCFRAGPRWRTARSACLCTGFQCRMPSRRCAGGCRIFRSWPCWFWPRWSCWPWRCARGARPAAWRAPRPGWRMQPGRSAPGCWTARRSATRTSASWTPLYRRCRRFAASWPPACAASGRPNSSAASRSPR